jgi:hypothetical protein
MEYLLLMLSLTSALLGIVGNAWDNTKTGLKKITPLGGIVITVLLFSSILTIYSTYKKNKEFSNIKSLVYSKIELGIWDILSPFNFNGPVKDTAEYFSKIKDTVYLSNLYKESLFDPIAKFGTNWTHPYRRDSIRIKRGEDLLNDVVDNYHDVLESKAIKYITNILTDDYYKSRYKLSKQHDLILYSLVKYNDTTLGPLERLHPQFSTYGSFYDDSGMNGQQSYDGILSLIQKIEVLYNHIKD